MSSNIFVDSINHETMRTAVLEYRQTEDLEVHERAALSSIIEHVRDKRILDIGVGAGRTVTGLREISDDYIGIDYVREMVDHCRGRFPGVRFDRVDARSMDRFTDASFDLIVFACNGICMVDHAGRLQILREVHRLLAPGGFFFFSTSNLGDPRRDRFLELPGFDRTLNPGKAAARGARFVGETAYRFYNRVRFRRHQVRTEEYEILNGKSHHYRTMIYFIGLEQQRRQLVQAGFQPNAMAFDLAGKAIETESQDGTISFIARK
jgi:SAM-dependent methyltransferase